MEKLARGKRASEKQKDFLINYLEKNLDIANDKYVTVDGVKFRDEKWKELAANLNNLDGTRKDSARWKKYWSDLRLHTRAKYNEKKKAEGRNSITRLKPLSALEARIIKITTDSVDEKPEFGLASKSIVSVTYKDAAEQLTANILDDSDYCNVASTTADYSSTSNASTTKTIASSKRRKRKVRIKAPQYDKFFKIEEEKLHEMKVSNDLKREKIAILKEQLEATKKNTEAIEAAAKAKENIAIKLLELIHIVGQKRQTD